MNPNIIKAIIIVVVLALYVYPVIVLSIKKRISYKAPNNKKNIIFLIFAIIELVAIIILINLLQGVVTTILSIPFIGNLISQGLEKIPAAYDYVIYSILAVLLNIIILHGCMLFKSIFVRHIKKTELKAQEKPSEETDDEKPKKKKRRLLFKFKHPETLDDQEGDGKKYKLDEFGDLEEVEEKNFKLKEIILGAFFVAPDYVHVKPWVYKCVKILQLFIYILEALYLIIFAVLLVTVFFPLPEKVCAFLINTIAINKWYMYPFASIIVLQEVCNVFNSTLSKDSISEVEEEEAEEESKLVDRLNELRSKIQKRFDGDHHLRFYPSTIPTEIPEYQWTNVAYAPALDFIKNHMQHISGHTVQSYLECLDAMYNDNHVYFCASFYSEFGEYLVAYIYTRLLAGERVIIVIPESKERNDFKRYIRRRLNHLTRTQEECTWRVYTSDERLDQADVLIAAPEEFKNDNIVINYPVFFEEVCNAIFVDSDKIVMTDSYLCPIISMRLLRATNDRIKFLFLTNSVYRGFAAGSLPKFFCIDKVLNFSGARENECVDYNLWNRESKNNKIYNKFGQKLTTPEALIAELALEHNIDGVRVITDAPIEHGDKESLMKHEVEINNFYKEIPDVNYLIYTDNRCNLSAAVYLCARFRGKKNSVVHILSKPYLLREFFMSKMTYEDFINRSSFIQPRVIEHVNNQRLSLLKIYCDATDDDGVEMQDFLNRMKNVISLAVKREEKILCPRCEKIISKVKYEKDGKKYYNVNDLSLKDLTEYLIAGLCDTSSTLEKDSYGIKAKDYFIVVEGNRTDGFNIVKTKSIFFKRTKEVFDKILERNERVSLILNDVKIGELNTFPSRVKSEFIIGQNITFKNVEYEIEQISDDCKSVFLKRENVTFKNILDTITLKRFKVTFDKMIGLPGVLYFSKTNLRKIEVKMFRMGQGSTGETYGFYNLMSDTQTLDFVRGVLGNPMLTSSVVRKLKGEKVLQLSLEARIECNDGMRLLLSAVFNEFIKTLFPDAYKCISVVPILETPYDYDDKHIPTVYEDFVKKLYPYLNNSDGKLSETLEAPIANEDGTVSPHVPLVEEDKNKCRFLFINDCEGEDIGVLDWFYDRMGHLMQELLINVNSYLAWLKLRVDQKHYIYFGNEELPQSFDLDGCCELLNGLNLVLSDAGADNFETASDENEDVVERCSFCHKIVESGRFTIFNENRFICAECFDVVDTQEKINQYYEEILKYLTVNYPIEKFEVLTAKLDGQYKLEKGKEFTEFYYNVDLMNKIVGVEKDIPINNAKVALLRATINLWQSNNNLLIPYIDGQLYYEEIKYLRSIGEDISADWIYENVSDSIKKVIDEISKYINPVAETSTEEDSESESEASQESTNKELTSFDFMREMAKLFNDESTDDESDGLGGEEDDDKGLFNPNYIPRFWKRYLRTMFNPDDESDEDDPTLNRDEEGIEEDNNQDDNSDEDLDNGSNSDDTQTEDDNSDEESENQDESVDPNETANEEEE